MTTTEDRLHRWLVNEHGIVDVRRIVREDDNGFLLSKVPSDLIGRVGVMVERLALFSKDDPIAIATADQAYRYPNRSRVDNWRAAVCDLIRKRAQSQGFSSDDADLLTVGVESVAAVMRAVLWSDPVEGEICAPSSAEIDAWRDVLGRTDRAGDLFTRHYGFFEGKAVSSHCPGAPYARAFMESAWRCCTGTPPPA
ncbi:MAG: hypothetical protein CL897_06635 [Dehalococcoidia bacterium]|nr:hypothetical protein [Dehalococcoidia bacterium]